MRNTIAFKPSIGVEKLRRLVKQLKYTSLNQFIDEAVMEKIVREFKNPKTIKGRELLRKIKGFLYNARN